MLNCLKLKNLVILAALGSATLSNAQLQDATLTITNADQITSIPGSGTITLVYSGTLNAPRGFNGAHLDIPYAYRFRSFAFSDKLEGVQAPELTAWMSDLGVHTNGGFYTGPLFRVDIVSTTKSGYYNHSGASFDIHPQVFASFSGGINFQSNRVGYSVGVDGPLKQILIQLSDSTCTPYWNSYVFDVEAYQGSTLIGTYPGYNDAGLIYLDEVLPSGLVDFRVKGGHWLSRRKTANIVGGYSFGNNFNLQNGDVDGDDVVSIFDYIILSDYFEKTWEDADWSDVGSNGYAPYRADLDEDGAVSIFDYIILSDHFEMEGE